MKERWLGSPLILVAFAASMECGGRMIDGVRPADSDGGVSTGSSSSSITTGGSTTSGNDTSGSNTSGSGTSGSNTSGGLTTTSSTTFGSGSTVSTTTFGLGGASMSTTTSSGVGGVGIGGSGGRGGSGPGLPVYCMSAPIPGSDQRIDCKKLTTDLAWSCSCGRGGIATSCVSKIDFPCGAANCCGYDTGGEVGCPATPPTIPPILGCIGPIQKGYFACSHVTHLNAPTYGPFTSCCPRETPFSCPTGTPGNCFKTAAEARANCKDWCVQCVPTVPPPP